MERKTNKSKSVATKKPLKKAAKKVVEKPVKKAAKKNIPEAVELENVFPVKKAAKKVVEKPVKKAAKKVVEKPVKKAAKKNIPEAVELENVFPVEEIAKTETLSTQMLPKEIVETTKSSKNWWDKIVGLFRDKIFLCSLVAVLIIITIVFNVQKNSERKEVKTEIVKKDSASVFVKTDAVFVENPKSVYIIKELEHELEFTRENYNKALNMLESR